MTEYENNYNPQNPQPSATRPGQAAYNPHYGQAEQVGIRPEYARRPAGITSRLRNPLVLTSILLGAGVVFAFIISSVFSGTDGPDSVPVVTADAGPVKVRPSDPGGAQMANTDSTVFDVFRSDERTDKRVENLLAEQRSVPDSVQSLIEFSQEAGNLIEKPAPEGLSGRQAEQDHQISVKNTQDLSDGNETIASADNADEADQEELQAARRPYSRPDQIHSAGSSPETLAFVRSVLEKKDGAEQSGSNAALDSEDQAAQLARTEPAAGSPSKAAGVAGTYFVQLASVSSRSGAENEWGKVRDLYAAVLSEASYRIQEANLGARGVFYRIQAGPFSKSEAQRICDSIKAQKPGACLVVR